ncbi:hypothetical protein CF327_g5164 [Tilletia walkeri]|uniref:Uncharacterized protein n=1 Tax=Tilletia walkeri TaxID=117179 RepID=A0A8X7T183_9BASI|nr:hypothetical protein CF327_g5164 [Tilletia walkeri]KAE8263578.1 hypothetical protein A4X09_0g7194 [Tilletia walkeri]
MSGIPIFPPPHLVSDAKEGEEQRIESQQQQPPIMGALPAPSDIQESTTTPTNLNVASDSSSTFKFDALGPLVVNTDGTLSRIHNWSSMTESERERTLRVLGKRNKIRMADLRAMEEGGSGGGGEQTGKKE